MAVNQDANTIGVPIHVDFTEQGASCLPPSIMDAFRAATWRASFPQSLSGTGNGGVQASTLPDNITRIDSEGKIYTPGITKIEIAEQIVTLTTTTAPGVPVEISFTAPGVNDLQNTINNIQWDIQPPESPVYISPPRLFNGRIYYNIYRIDNGSTPPYQQVIVRGFGRLFVVPSPSPL